jgi:D-glycero-D-manno-heptose 1,7-bisphosphate phosphatase
MSRRAVFLDRDGVINEAIVKNGRPYPPAHLGELVIPVDVPAALAGLKQDGFLLIVVTNQPDVARGTTPRSVVDGINGHLRETLLLDDIMTCFHDEADQCACRKPRPGMMLQARDDHGLDLARSFLVGDRWRDIDAGHAAGCRTIFLNRGYDERQPDSPDFVCVSLSEAAAWIRSVAAQT